MVALPSASNLWVQSSLNQKQRLQQLFFPEGVRFDGKRLVGTGLTLPVFSYLAPAEDSEVRMVDLTGIEPVTSSMPLMRAPNCATGPLVGKRNL